MAKRGLPTGMSMRHDSHYVEDLVSSNRTVGRIISINLIEPNPDQPRVEIGDLGELSSSIKEKGVLEPILVKPNKSGKWMIIAGERRWRAANLAGLEEVPCIELDIDEQSIAEIALIENLQRKDLTIWEEADGFAALAKKYGYKHDDIAKKIGKSRSSITEAMAIAGLPKDIRERCINAQISSKSTLLEISRQFDDQAMNQLLDNILEKNLKREEVRQVVRPQFDPTPVSNSSITKEKPVQTIPTNQFSKKKFQYTDKHKSFILEIKFNRQNFYDTDDVRSALEEVLKSLPK